MVRDAEYAMRCWIAQNGNLWVCSPGLAAALGDPWCAVMARKAGTELLIQVWIRSGGQWVGTGSATTLLSHQKEFDTVPPEWQAALEAAYAEATEAANF